MYRVAGDDMARHVEFLQQLLHGGDFVGLLADLDMRQHKRRVGGERTEHLLGLGVVEVIETAVERLAIERDDARAGIRGEVQVVGVFTKHLFNVRRAQPLYDISRGIG